MHTATFTTEAGARHFAAYYAELGYIIDSVDPPQKPGSDSLMGRWVVWYH